LHQFGELAAAMKMFAATTEFGEVTALTACGTDRTRAGEVCHSRHRASEPLCKVWIGLSELKIEKMPDRLHDGLRRRKAGIDRSSGISAM
jgi:hypothetical protein